VKGMKANAFIVRLCFGLAKIWRTNILITWLCRAGLRMERRKWNGGVI